MNSGSTIEVYVGHVGLRDTVAVPFEVVRVAKVEIEGVCLWCLARERGRALRTSNAISRTNMMVKR